MEALRETLRSESQRLAQAELELARTERELAAAQREQLEAMRARLLEEFNSLGDTVRVLGFGEYAGLGPIAPLQGARFQSSKAPFYYSLLPSTSVTSWMVGNRALAGAELTDLNPSLARYFDVGEGVLVTEVAEDSPAAEADLRPGDVIVRVDGGPVASIEEVRDAVGQAAFGAGFTIGAWQGATREPPEPITLSIVREGSPLELALPR
jgi:hypothetical protein